ncbi:hypothetical protein, partial [Yersinia mollaretii]|uniref:hypothetical protein n=1 Tax=Yersinia mollaretii TaxID=33060 RepID=UPI001C127835
RFTLPTVLTVSDRVIGVCQQYGSSYGSFLLSIFQKKTPAIFGKRLKFSGLRQHVGASLNVMPGM